MPRDADLAAAARDQHPDAFDGVLDLVNYAPDVRALATTHTPKASSRSASRNGGPVR